ncbi:MAG: GTP-binding protein [Erythrobacter sp. RIFCSPHIGHO2_12_FULL_63_10]|nr:MAG: GTP-binding protein [Erythrobacter sp. RIFCSPHIGHO2_12_FULL_63_10]
MLDLFASSPNLAAELFERTASSFRVQETVRLSLTPAFLLAAIGAVMNVMMSRLIWVADRIERLDLRMESEGESERALRELKWLQRRRLLAQRAVVFSTLAALTICVVIALLFVSAFIEPQIGSVTAVAWIATMVFLVTSLVLLVQETMVAARGHRLRK